MVSPKTLTSSQNGYRDEVIRKTAMKKVRA